MGLNISIANAGSVRRQYAPNAIAREDALSATNLVAWYDFGDASTVFEDAAGTDAAETGDKIKNITNKAYDGLGSSSTSLNTAIKNTSVGTGDDPTWTYSAGIGYADFDGGDYLSSTRAIGNVASGKMGGVTLTQENFTISVVIDNDATAPSALKYYFAFTNAARVSSAFGISSANRAAWLPIAGSLPHISSGTAYSGTQEFWTIVGGTANTAGADVRTLAFYQNGVLKATDTTDLSTMNRVLTADDADVNFYLGQWNGAATDALDGKIYEYIQYNKALSPLQLAQLHGYYAQKYQLS
jgi:hypothetical protein